MSPSEEVGDFWRWSARAVRRLANRLAPTSIEALGRLVEADHSGRPPLPKGNPLRIWIDEAYALSVLSDEPRPILMGRHLLELGFEPGKSMGVMLSRAFELQLDGIFDNLEDAKQWARDNKEWLNIHMGQINKTKWTS